MSGDTSFTAPLGGVWADGSGYDPRAPAARILGAGGIAGRAAADALALAGFRLLPGAGATAPDPDAFDGVDLIAIEGEGADDAALEALLARADAAAGARGLALLVTVALEQIDLAAAQLRAAGAQLLCRPTMADRVSAAAWARSRGRARLHDVSREGDSVRLQRLHEEVARIADALARLSRSGDGQMALAVRDPGSGYRGPDGGDPGEPSAREVRACIRARRLRGQFFAGDLFADPAWDMLLDLFAADLERRRVSVSSLCIAAAVPPTTALRWIGTLHEAGLFERHADPNDRRRAYIGLSNKALEGMRSYAGALRRAGLSFV